MDSEEPTTGDLLASITDTVASNRLVDVISRKFRAQSYPEFFNRIWGVGMLLFLIGMLGLVVANFFEQGGLDIFDLGNTIFLAIAALAFWLVLVMVRVVNVGSTPIYDEQTARKQGVALKIFAGLVLTIAVVYQMFIQSSKPIENLVFTFIAAILMGMWLLALGWLFGGLSALARTLSSTNNP